MDCLWMGVGLMSDSVYPYGLAMVNEMMKKCALHQMVNIKIRQL